MQMYRLESDGWTFRMVSEWSRPIVALPLNGWPSALIHWTVNGPRPWTAHLRETSSPVEALSESGVMDIRGRLSTVKKLTKIMHDMQKFQKHFLQPMTNKFITGRLLQFYIHWRSSFTSIFTLTIVHRHHLFWKRPFFFHTTKLRVDV